MVGIRYFRVATRRQFSSKVAPAIVDRGGRLRISACLFALLCLPLVFTLIGCQPEGGSATSASATTSVTAPATASTSGQRSTVRSTRPVSERISAAAAAAADRESPELEPENGASNDSERDAIPNATPNGQDLSAVANGPLGGGDKSARSTPAPIKKFRVLTDPRPLHKPLVVLSQAHADSCLVQVGDAFPEFELSDLAGASRNWRDLLGEKLTIVVLWHSRSVYAVEQVNRLELETAEPYQGTGVNVVAVNVGDTAEQLRDWLNGSESPVTHLLDPQREAFAQIATHRFPRTYLLDTDGRILWLDLEYSQTTRRELENAVRYFLKTPRS